MNIREIKSYIEEVIGTLEIIAGTLFWQNHIYLFAWLFWIHGTIGMVAATYYASKRKNE